MEEITYKRSLKQIVWALALAGLLSTPLMAAKPIAIVAGGARYDIPRFIRRVLTANDYVWEQKGNFLDPAEFSKYSIVVWFSGFRRPLTTEQLEALHAYLEQGGILFHTASGLYRSQSLPGAVRNYPWIGATAWRYHGAADSQIKGKFLLPEHPYLTGIDTSRDYHWLQAYYSLKLSDAAVNIIGTPTASIFSATPVGLGAIVWFWQGLFRCSNWQKPDDDAALERVFLNILRSAQPLTAEQQLRAKVPAFADNPEALVCWRRDWADYARKDYVFQPIHPTPDERRDAFIFTSAIDERDTQFLLCQSLTPQHVTTSIKPLIHQKTQTAFPDALSLFVSDKPPVVHRWVRKGEEDLPARLGRFMLLPVTNGFAIHDFRPRVLWVEVATHGLPPGQYRSSLKLQGQSTAVTLPITVDVHPVRMPANRLVELRYWGVAVPNREPHLTELARQSSRQIALTYPDTRKILIRPSGQSLRDALQRNPEVFSPTNFPALDFRPAYDDQLMLALKHQLAHIRITDVRTGRSVAQAGTGKPLSGIPRVDFWPLEARQLYTHYYRELYTYLQERGFEEADELWMDEPSWASITNNYVPRAALHMAGGMGSGCIWSASGFMTPEQVNRFAPYTTDWSMYTIGLPNFLNFVRTGVARLHPRARVGIARGGSGHALRSPYNRSRTLGWTIVHYGQPVSFLRTGPLWKEWLYYVDYEASAKRRSRGVGSERLIAYGSSDSTDTETAMLSSSDWEGSRDGVDDANLVRMLEWYLDQLTPQASSDPALATIIREINADRATWFKGDTKTQETSGFDGNRLVEAEEESVADSADIGFTVLRKHFEHGANVYDYENLQPLSSDRIEAIKRRVLQHLSRLAPYADRAPASLHWHDWELVVDGNATSIIIVSAQTAPAVVEAVFELQLTCRQLAGQTPALERVDDWTPDDKQVSLIVGQSTDALIQSILKRHGWSADSVYPGTGSYLIKRDQSEKLLLVVGTDEAGLRLGLKNFSVFLQATGHWIIAGKHSVNPFR